MKENLKNGNFVFNLFISMRYYLNCCFLLLSFIINFVKLLVKKIIKKIKIKNAACKSCVLSQLARKGLGQPLVANVEDCWVLGLKFHINSQESGQPQGGMGMSRRKKKTNSGGRKETKRKLSAGWEVLGHWLGSEILVRVLGKWAEERELAFEIRERERGYKRDGRRKERNRATEETKEIWNLGERKKRNARQKGWGFRG